MKLSGVGEDSVVNDFVPCGNPLKVPRCSYSSHLVKAWMIHRRSGSGPVPPYPANMDPTLRAPIGCMCASAQKVLGLEVYFRRRNNLFYEPMTKE